jgi:hypothetical protein
MSARAKVEFALTELKTPPIGIKSKDWECTTGPYSLTASLFIFTGVTMELPGE